MATNTISLQEQLLDKDIPAVRTLMEETSSLKNFLNFRCALLVGRANYLCTTRLHRALSGQGELFEGSKYLLAWADRLKELRAVCHCGSKATMIVRVSEDGSIIRSGEQVEIGGNERYLSLCRKCFYKGAIGS